MNVRPFGYIKENAAGDYESYLVIYAEKK